jgi:hypothetical protein
VDKEADPMNTADNVTKLPPRSAPDRGVDRPADHAGDRHQRVVVPAQEAISIYPTHGGMIAIYQGVGEFDDSMVLVAPQNVTAVMAALKAARAALRRGRRTGHRR